MSQVDIKREPPRPAATHRRTAPVFVVGCPRSGTTMLYHMLLSSGGFAIYRSESNVFNLLVPRFNGMRSIADRQQLLNLWLRSNLFRVSGLDAGNIANKILADCRSGGDFLRIVMQEAAYRQGVLRWADCTPEHLLYMQEIKRQIPDALFIHIIRDGRDVALSYAKQGWAYPLPWDRKNRLGVAGLYWEWLVRKGRASGKYLGSDYREVHFEDLIANPQEALRHLGSFMDHELDYEQIEKAAIGSVSEPNTSFSAESDGFFNPVSRWKTKMSAKEISDFEQLVGDSLSALGYELSSGRSSSGFRVTRMRATYLPLFATKHWMRTRTPLGRFVRLDRIQIESKR